MGYLHSQVEYAEFKENTLLRRAFRKHLGKVAAAMRAIEWNDSGDGAKGEDELIRACLTPEYELQQAKEELVQAILTADELMKIFGYDKTAPTDDPGNNNEAA